jgi:hypothetical protein
MPEVLCTGITDPLGSQLARDPPTRLQVWTEGLLRWMMQAEDVSTLNRDIAIQVMRRTARRLPNGANISAPEWYGGPEQIWKKDHATGVLRPRWSSIDTIVDKMSEDDLEDYAFRLEALMDETGTRTPTEVLAEKALQEYEFGVESITEVRMDDYSDRSGVSEVDLLGKSAHLKHLGRYLVDERYENDDAWELLPKPNASGAEKAEHNHYDDVEDIHSFRVPT